MGRPVTGARTVVTVRMWKETLDAFDKRAKREGIERSTVIRRILEDAAKKLA
jgi:metal-responsive CopG/Arc/MetJ family transcriptional regulator